MIAHLDAYERSYGSSVSSAGARPLRVLFIARAFPPTVGGMENFAYQLSEHLRDHADVTALINRGGKRLLPLFLPYATAAAIRIVRRDRIDVVHLADALLAPLGAAVKMATGVPVTASVCGLDVTYANRAYQEVVPRALRQLDMTMPISAATMAVMRHRTGTSHRAQTIPLGVNPIAAPSLEATSELTYRLGVVRERPLLLSVGRLVERKGVAWFVRNVLPQLPQDVIYAVVGEGPEREVILAAATDAGVADRLRLLGRLSDDLLAASYKRADVFVMPNVPIDGDIEGFGLVALEAAASGLPVVASRLEGITEALQHEFNGLLVTAADTDAYVRQLASLLALPASERQLIGSRAAEYTERRYGWDRAARQYVEAMRSVVSDRRSALANNQHLPI